MQRGFPLSLLHLVCCPLDCGQLRPKTSDASKWLKDGDVRCVTCGVEYAVRDGVLSLVDLRQLHPDSALEMDVRDLRSAALLDGSRKEWQSRFADATEVQPTLDAVALRPGMSVCELGCGPGRYTLRLSALGATVVAVDFSSGGLRVLRSRLERESQVALVQADVTRAYGARAAFNRMLSTLHSNLPDGHHRHEALRWMAYALADDGRAVVSMHHRSARDLLTGTPVSGRYPDSGIYRRHLTQRESMAEVRPSFRKVTHRYIAAGVPGLPSPRLARAMAHTPLLRAALSRLFLAVVASPIRNAGAA